MKIVEMNNPQQNEADIVGGIKKFFRKLPKSAEKEESNFTNQLIQSITKALQRAEDFNLLAPITSPASPNTTYGQQGIQPSNVTYNQKGGQPATQPAAAQTQAPTPISQPITFAGKKYTKGPKGWIDDKGKPADFNTSKILDQAQAKANQPPNTPKPSSPASSTKPAQSITTGPNNKMSIKGLQMREDAYYDKLNDLFEGIITLQEGNISVSDFITNRWFGPWARNIAAKNPNVNLLNQNVINQVKNIAKEIESTYASNKGVNAIRKLSDYLTNTYYDTLNQVGQSPTQTQPEKQSKPFLSIDNMSDWSKERYGVSGTSSPTRTSSSYNLNQTTIEQYFDDLYRRDPNLLNNIIKKLIQKYRVV